MNVLDRASASLTVPDAKRNWIDTYIDQYIVPFSFGGHQYQVGALNQTYSGIRTQEIVNTLPSYAAALRQCPPAFAAQMVRALVLSQARFIFRNPPYGLNPRRIFGKPSLRRLENPWPNATTGELVSRMEWHAGVAGNSFVYGGDPNRLRVLRPDWTAIVYGSDREPEDPMHALDGEIIGYVYQNGGLGYGGRITTLRPADVAHWSPIPDPESPGLGMSWITPALREIRGDIGYSEHKLRFLANGATPNLVVKGIPVTDPEQFNEIVDAMEAKHKGLGNAYRTLYLTAGADATVIGSDMKQMDFATTQGRAETRIAFLSRVPASILQISEGLQGASLNSGNFGPARRNFADTWVFPTLQDLCACLAPLVQVPDNAELWFDTADMPLLREDGKDAAEIEQVKASTITGLVQGGFTPESAIAAVMGQNMSLLKPIPGWLSVQLQPKGQTPPPAPDPQPPTQNDSGQPRSESHIHIDARTDLGELVGTVVDEARDAIAATIEETRAPFLELSERVRETAEGVRSQLEASEARWVETHDTEKRVSAEIKKAAKLAERSESAALAAEQARVAINNRIAATPESAPAPERRSRKKAKVSFTYDRQGRIVSGQTAEGRTIHVDYDRSGNVLGAHED